MKRVEAEVTEPLGPEDSQGLLSRRLSLGTGHRAYGVRVVPQDTVRLMAFAGAVFVATAGITGLIIRVTFGGVLAHPQGLEIASWVGVAVGALLGVLGVFASAFVKRRFPVFVYLCIFGIPLIVTASMYSIGPKWIGPVILYVEVPIFAFYLLSRSVAIVALLAISGQFAALVSLQPGYPAPGVEWLSLGGTLAVIGGIFGLFLDRADAVADSERRARSELAALNRDLEQRVSHQVEELGRLQRLRRFLSPQVADAVLDGDSEALLAPHRRQIAVFFCDLRGFTGFASGAEPEEVVEVLDAYYATVGQGLRAYEATVGTFAGDGIMAYLNDPVPCLDPPGTAVEMALSLTQSMGELVSSWERKGFQLGYGIGIAYGYATLGTIGFEGRNDYTALGSVVNLAARLCGEAAPAELLIDQRTHDAVSDRLSCEPRALTLKGLPGVVTGFSVLGLQ